ncbi:MAG: ABC transporter permease [Hyphomicrobiales bacterium]|nr:ABC transporter permease [Hyphomicrobiales bacterium]
MAAIERLDRAADAHEQHLLQREERHVAAARRRDAFRVRGLRTAVVGAILVAWWAASGTLIDRLFVSDPIAVLRSLVQIALDGSLWWHLERTLLAMTLGYIVGVIGGIALAVLMTMIPWGDRMARPFMLGVFAIPKVALAPLVIVWFGIHLLPKVILSASLVLFIVYFSTLAGFAAVNRDLVASLRVMGASRSFLFFGLTLPSAAPYIFSAMQITLPGALIGAIIGEFVSSNRGVGFLIAHASSRYDTAQVFAGIFSLLIFVLIANAILARVERYVARWRPETLRRGAA